MNGIEPPTPMSTGAVPSQASVNAARAASYAGPVASIWVASPVSTAVIVSSAPHGDVLLEVLAQPGAAALAVVSPGAMRRLRCGSGRRAPGCCDAPATLGASRPVIDSAGLVQSRSTVEPLADPLDAGDGAGLGAQPLLGVLDVGGRTRVEAGDGDVAGVVVERGDQPAQRHQRVGDQAAPHAGVDGVGQGTDLDVRADQAAEAGGEGGLADVPVAGVGDHDDVRGEGVLVGLEQRGQGVGADLLLPLDEERDADRQVVAVDPQRRGGAPRSPPCRRRHRARTGGRRARSARTAGSPTRRGRSPAGRRGGRRAAPSASRQARPLVGDHGRGSTRRCRRSGSHTPRRRTTRSTASALRRTSPPARGSRPPNSYPDQVLQVAAYAGKYVGHLRAQLVGRRCRRHARDPSEASGPSNAPLSDS